MGILNRVEDIRGPTELMARYLVTGAAGFIGSHLSRSLLAQGHEVLGLDNVNDYYEVQLKHDRLATLTGTPGFSFVKCDLQDMEGLKAAYGEFKPQIVVNLAAQAGVRYSLEHPHAYTESNITGFLNILECARHLGCEHLVYASSSSVYGGNTKLPFSTEDGVDHPISLYAATKKANELMAHTYSHLFDIPTTGLRFFTVYGPWGRPDMAMFIFTRAILAGKPIQVFNRGDMQRDFTFVDDIVDGVIRVCNNVPVRRASVNGDGPRETTAPYRVYNIGNNKPAPLMYVIGLIEKELGREAVKELLPLQPGDVKATYADIDDLTADTGFTPRTSIEEGIAKFIAWFKEYYKVD